MVAFQSLMASFNGPFHSIVNLGATLQTAEGAMNRLEDVLRYPTDPQLDAGPPNLAPAISAVKLSGRLELRNVTFGYSRLDPPLIDDFSLTLKPGQRVALVGGSGSGKSTSPNWCAVSMRLGPGKSCLMDNPGGATPDTCWPTRWSFVDQDIFLFENTVSENLSLWDETIPESQIVQAAKDACIHEEIAARPGGYDSLVTEGGGNFSGGQRQRLEIARALVGNPSLLVLDEATSALDPLTESQIDDHLRHRGCTCLIVAHRLSAHSGLRRDCCSGARPSGAARHA